jgi:phosphate transport system protein
MATRATFDRELHLLQDEMLVMGSMVEMMLVDAVKTLKDRDLIGSERIIEQDKVVNSRRFAIEEQVLTLIALHQPMAVDLRTLAAILEITSELERIGDYAKGIAKVNLRLGDGSLMKPLIDLPIMAQKSQSMLHRVLDAFLNRDVVKAKEIAIEDNEVDKLYVQVYEELVQFVIAKPQLMEQANYLLWAAHNLERSADRVVNLCERVIFTVTGEMAEL